jgi:hypothetical protein
MKQTTALISLIVLLAVFSSSVIPQSNLKQMHLNGSIRTLTETISFTNDTLNQPLSSTFSRFTKSGMLVEKRILKNNKLFSKTIFEYSLDDEMLGFTDYNADGSVYFKVKCDCDDNGFVVSEQYDRSFQEKYNENRQVIDFRYDEIYEKIFITVIIKNDFKGYKLEEKFLNPNGTLSHRRVYKYDFKYNLTETKTYNSSNNLQKKYKNKYTRTDDLIKSKLFISNRLAVTSAYSYEFDLIGNWVKRIETREVEENIYTEDISRETFVSKRTIEYY